MALAWRWRSAGWVNKQGPVSNVDLWIRLLQLIDFSTLTIRWVKVPSHTVVVLGGNSRADKLAEQGCLGSPIYHSLSVPDGLVFGLELPCASTHALSTGSPKVS